MLRMELKDKNATASDEEEDLDKLRLAALQSLKKPSPNQGAQQLSANICTRFNGNTSSFSKSASYHKKNRGFGGRNMRNCLGNNRNRNSNLISIPTIEQDEPKPVKTTPPKLVLPQDRYCSASTSDLKEEPSSKFSRYDNSDNSDSESENDEQSGNSEDEVKLKRSISLEILMQELENHIQGEIPNEEKVRCKDDKQRNKEDKQKSAEEKSTLANEKQSFADEPLKLGDEKQKLQEEKQKVKPKKHKLKIVEVKSSSTKISDNAIEDNSECDNYRVKVPRERVYAKTTRDELPKENSQFNKQHICKRIQKPRKVEHRHNNYTANLHNAPYLPQSAPYQLDPFLNQNMPYNSNVLYNPMNSIPPQPMPRMLPNNYMLGPQATVPPLVINTDVLNIAMAPLSPRSAAFVLQNREIIERRKKSPRRSYSRSPSPRYKSPRKSLSPFSTAIRTMNSPRTFSKQRSLSPRRTSPSKDRYNNKPLSPSRHRQLSPVPKKSPISRVSKSPLTWTQKSPVFRTKSPISRVQKSPVLRQKSPVHRTQRSPVSRMKSPVSRAKSPVLRPKSPILRVKSPIARIQKSPVPRSKSPISKVPVKERLGSRTDKPDVEVTTRKRSRSISLTPSPEHKSSKIEAEEKDSVDPVLEARKRKFETKEVASKEGIIRLKLQKEKEEAAEKDLEGVNEDDLLEIDDFIDTKVDDLFSDEETDEENEGRFKLKTIPNANSASGERKRDNFKRTEKKSRRSETRDRKRSNYRDRRSRGRPLRDEKPSKPPAKDSEAMKESFKPEKATRQRATVKSDSKRDKLQVTSLVESKKIEIKIRNPSKYESANKYDVANEQETVEKLRKTVRKVEVAKSADEVEPEPEIIIDNEDDDLEDANSGGDLRAQLSRKRAERQSKLPMSENFQSRLLQSALEGAVYKQKAKKSKSKSSRPAAPKEPSAALKRTALAADAYYIKIGFGKRHVHGFMGSTRGERKVQLLHCSGSKILFGSADTKLPIHLRLGHSNVSFEKNRKKRNLDQV